MDTDSSTASHDAPHSPPPGNPPHDHSQRTVLSVLCYLGPLVILSYLLMRDDAFVKFHVRQGAVLFIAEIIVSVLFSFLWFLWPLWQLVNLALLILAIIGIAHAAKGRERELPFIGSFAKHVGI